MQAERELSEISPEKDTILTIGVFDGVHIGHKYLISRLKEQAQERALLSGIVTFNQHPLEVLSPETKLSYLTDIPEKTMLLQNEGVDFVAVLSFTTELAQLSAPQFLNLLKKHLRMQGLVIGPDFALGKRREGDIENLNNLGKKMNFSVTVMPPVKINGDVVSSTAIRQALANGEIAKVHKLIGRYFSLKGKVVTGDKRGAKLGFPTANLEVDPRQAVPANGVYATWAHIGGETYKSVTNIGLRPTFNGTNRLIEVYVLDYHADLYGEEIRIDFVQRLRGERKFYSAKALSNQITRDVEKVKSILNHPVSNVSRRKV